MAEYSRVAKGSFISAASQTNAVIPLPFVPDFVEVWNLTNIGAGAPSIGASICRAWWDNNAVVTPLAKSAANTMVEMYNNAGTGAIVFDTIANSTGISTFQGGIALQYGPTQTITGITAANPAVVSCTGHGYNVGDTVIMQGIALATTNNMQLLNNVPFTITAVTANTFTVKWDASGSNYANSGFTTASLVKKVLYPFLYLPEDNIVSFVTISTTTTVATTMYHNLETGQEIAFRIPKLWGITGLNSLPNINIPGQPIYGYVTSITDNWTFTCNINSSSFSAFTTNFTMTAVTLNGLTYPQVLSIGDVNSGGAGPTSASSLYPAPLFPTSTNRVATINGPAIRGAFVNNTSQGFIIGAGIPQIVTGNSATIVTTSSEIMWRAYLSDFANP